ncbi:TrgA family protein [Lentibacter sp.]|uniref:TrgA family protein n=1 Tax=Lentibacter sp. TaxID=2024994 RepID=UPI003F69FAE6
MPTAAKLLSAVCLAVVAYLVSDMVKAAMLSEDPDLQLGRLMEINVVISAAVGWWILGARVGNAYSVSLGLGLTAVASAVFYCVFTHAFWEMLQLSLDRKFDGPMEALIGAVQLAIDYSAELLRVTIIGTLVAGGLICGVFAEFANRRWR